jgi:RimJ/RimL family protein N-acetyltransferase
MLVVEQIRLRPVRRDDLPLMESWLNDVAINSEYNFFGLRPDTGLEGGFSSGGFLTDYHGELLIVTTDDSVIGSITYRQVAYGPNSGSQAYAIGLHLVPEARGQGYGTEAQRLMAAYLFATFPISRVEAQTDVTNLAEQRSLEKAGFTREGIIRQAQWRNGVWHDLVLYSKLRNE